MDHQIFVSYKRVDKEKVFPIKEYLEKNTGFKFWIDLDGIESDARFTDVIINAINCSEVFLFFYSKEYYNIIDYDRDWCIRELDFAEYKRKRIVFINIDGSDLTDKLYFKFREKQQVDARDTSRLDRLVKDINLWLKKEKEANKPKEVIQTSDTTKTSSLETSSLEEVNAKKDVKESKAVKVRSTQSEPSESDQKILKKDLQNSLAFVFQDNKFFMVLSDDKSFYIGNINAKKNDLSWIKNDVIFSLGAGTLCTSALSITVGTPLTLILGGIYETLKNVFCLSKKKKLTVDANLCHKLYESTGYKFRVPTIDQLKGVEQDQRTSCIILSCEDNPSLFFEKNEGTTVKEDKDNLAKGMMSMEEIVKEFGDIFPTSGSSKFKGIK